MGCGCLFCICFQVASPALVVRGWPNRIASREVGTSEVRKGKEASVKGWVER